MLLKPTPTAERGHHRLRRIVAAVERGQALSEYAILLALMAIAIVFALSFAGGGINDAFDNIGQEIADVGGGGGEVVIPDKEHDDEDD